MEHKIFSTECSMVEIVKARDFNGGEFGEIWQWEVTIAIHQTTYKGKAAESNRKVTLDWVELTTNQPLNEMIERCKKYMNRNE